MSMSMPQRSTSWEGRPGRWPAWRRRTETPVQALAIPEPQQHWEKRVVREVGIEAAFDRGNR